MRLRRRICGLCLMPEISHVRDACDFCGVTAYEMYLAELRPQL